MVAAILLNFLRC